MGSNTDDETDTPDTEDGGETTATDGEGSDDDGSDEGTGDESPGEQVSRLPESHPLSDELVDLILAEDRQSFAETHDLAYQDGAVQVEIRLVEGGESPEQYLPEDRSEYGDTVIAYVNVDNLVDLALNDDIRRIFRRFPDEPG